MCQLCERLGYRWAVCVNCDIEFAYHGADQLAALETGRMDSVGGWPWFVDGHVPDWLVPAMVWDGAREPDHCYRCEPAGWHMTES